MTNAQRMIETNPSPTPVDAPALAERIEACATSCKQCGNTCAEHHEHCRVCMEARHHCESACDNLLSAMSA